MYIKRNFNIFELWRFSGRHLIWLGAWALIAYAFYELLDLSFLTIPWLPVSLVGIAVAFYVGFKNNAAYDRMWEARKIWGAIVNDSRSWANGVKHFVSNQFTEGSLSDEELHGVKQRMIYRHIAWLYTLRKQLLITTEWEHLGANRMIRKVNEERIKRFGIGLLNEKPYEEMMGDFLSANDFEQVKVAKNGATRLIDQQGADLAHARSHGLIDDFRHIALQNLLNNFYTHQGKCERIKKYPFPRQYASTSFVFISIFIFLLPFGLMPEFANMGPGLTWLAIPFTMLVGWVFLMMELVGDYSENPFEGLGNDIPMMALCRTIEIDLRQMLGETELPKGVEAKNHVLM